MASSVAADDAVSSFLIREVTGTLHELELIGRCLPYRGLAFEGTMRAEVDWYPGNPVATLQMLGASEAPTTVQGMWKDRFVRTIADDGSIVVGQAGTARFNGVALANVRSIVQAVDAFRMRGQLIEVSWDEHIRVGYLKRFKHVWHRHEDVEWEMEFEWISRGEPLAPIAFGIEVSAPSLVSDLLALFQAIQDAVESVFAIVNDITAAIQAAADLIDAAISTISEIARKIDQAIMGPFEAARAVVAALENVKIQALAIASAFETLPARAYGNIAGSVAALAAITQSDALRAERVKRKARRAARDLARKAAIAQNDYAATTTTQPNVQTVTAQDNQDLRDISTRFYGTPHQWRRIASYNGIKGSRLTAGQTVLVPPLNSVSGQ